MEVKLIEVLLIIRLEAADVGEIIKKGSVGGCLTQDAPEFPRSDPRIGLLV
jgi:hypothetical protein